MVIRIDRNRNTNDAAAVSTPIVLDAITSTTIAVANDERIFFQVNNDSANKEVWIKLQAASVDNDKKGIFLNKKGVAPASWEMPTDNIYSGEISAIADSGVSTVYVTEY